MTTNINTILITSTASSVGCQPNWDVSDSPWCLTFHLVFIKKKKKTAPSHSGVNSHSYLDSWYLLDRPRKYTINKKDSGGDTTSH